MKLSSDSVAGCIARVLKARGIERVFALCGGHIMPIWMRLDAEGIRIIDVRDERAAVHMAQAQAELTAGLGVALVTAGPGVTNAMTGIANAHVARAPVLILSGTPPRPQENRGGLQDVDHTLLLRSITRYARTVREPTLALTELDEAIARAFGECGEPGPAYLDFPTDTLRSEVPKALQLPEHIETKLRPEMLPDPTSIARAIEVLWSAKRVLVISGRGARGAGPELVQLLDKLQAVYLDTGESRGLVPETHPSVVAAMRGVVMSDADVVLTIGRRLDFQLAFDRLQCSVMRASCASVMFPANCATTDAERWRSARHLPPRSGRLLPLRAITDQRSIRIGRRGYAPVTWSAPPSCEQQWLWPQKARMGVFIRTRYSPRSRRGSTPPQL
jgi:acetolactate synthase I/II/III large subunit